MVNTPMPLSALCRVQRGRTALSPGCSLQFLNLDHKSGCRGCWHSRKADPAEVEHLWLPQVRRGRPSTRPGEGRLLVCTGPADSSEAQGLAVRGGADLAIGVSERLRRVRPRMQVVPCSNGILGSARLPRSRISSSLGSEVKELHFRYPKTIITKRARMLFLRRNHLT